MANAIISRSDAIAQGLKRYFTGVPCKNGHVAERVIADNGRCVTCSVDKHIRYRKRHPEKSRAAGKRYAERHPDKVRARRQRRYAKEARPKRIVFASEQERIERSRERHRLYRRNDPDRAKASQKRYRERNREKVRERERVAEERRKIERRERAAQEGRAFRGTLSPSEKKERQRALARERYHQKALETKRQERARYKNPDRERLFYSRWAKANPEKVRAKTANRRARKINAQGSHTSLDRENIIELQRYRCAYCRLSLRRAPKHLDHIIPLARGGTNDRANLQYLCAPCNQRKSAKHPVQFAQELGLLL